MSSVERRRPQPEGRGYLRFDSVHQGDCGKVKGVDHINMVDEVTQCQFVGSVERIEESFLLPVLESLLEAFPFEILGLHADNVLRVHQPPSGAPFGEAAYRAVHQVTGLVAAGFRELSLLSLTGQVARPELLGAVVAFTGHCLLFVGCLVACLRVP